MEKLHCVGYETVEDFGEEERFEVFQVGSVEKWGCVRGC
jgi:hypothetical protein